MNALAIFGNVMLATVSVVLIAKVLWRLIVWARTRETGAYVLGVLFSPFMGVGDVVDPDFRMVDETKRVKEKEEDDSGDPPNAEGKREPRDHEELE